MAALEILVVTTRQSRHWIVPKGWPIKRLTPSKSAAREAFEEAGVRGKIGARAIGNFTYKKTARQTDAEQNRPQYADPISCPVLAVGAQAYLGDAVSRQLAQVARDVRGAVIPASGHNIALENPAALAQAYLEFFADR